MRRFLYAHAAGYWAKEIRGRMHYFGPWEDPDGALAKYLDQKDDLHAGRTPRAAQSAFTVKDAVNAFLNEKKSRVEAGDCLMLIIAIESVVPSSATPLGSAARFHALF